MENVVGHIFIIANVGDSNYIIDPSFVQFAYIDFEEMYINHLRVKPKSPFHYAAKINEDMNRELVGNGYIKLNEDSASWYGNSFYHTLTNIKDDYKFEDVPGKVYIDKFLQGNERLREYNYSEIKVSDNTGGKIRQ